MKNSNINICSAIETRMNKIIDKINKMDSIFESDPLDSELRILEWIFYKVCSSEIKKLKVNLTGGMKMDSTMQSASCPPISP